MLKIIIWNLLFDFEVKRASVKKYTWNGGLRTLHVRLLVYP